MQNMSIYKEIKYNNLSRYPTFTPANIPVVDTLKSKYANISGDVGLKILASFFLGISSI